MKYLSLFAFFIQDQKIRRNLRSLFKYLAFLGAVITLYSIVFHLIMAEYEGRQHSWVTGFYWTLTVMSTLGFGDITFKTDIGMMFSILVLVSGLVLLLIVLPFAFIKLFYAPWLESRIRQRAPKSLTPHVHNHIIICQNDETLAPGLIERLGQHDIPYCVIEPNPVIASQLHADGIKVANGSIDNPETYRMVGARRALMVLANHDDATNTNITLTVREVDTSLPITAIAENEHSIDILTLSGATHVLPLKLHLGEQLANRISAGPAHAHVIGSLRNLDIAEFPVANTPFAGKSVRDCRIREICGANIIGIWDRARMKPVHPDFVLHEFCTIVVVGDTPMIEKLNEYLCIYAANYNPVVVIGGGRVGLAAAKSLKNRGISVTLIEKDPNIRDSINEVPDRLIIGDAAQRETMINAGLPVTPSVLLTTNNDAINTYLCVYCRKLNPDVRIVSRITHERNVASMQRAGADLILSYSHLAVESILSLAQNQEVVLLGEGVRLFNVAVPRSLIGKTLSESQIGAKTGLNVIAINAPTGDVIIPRPSTLLEEGQILFMIGESHLIKEFSAVYK